MIIIVWKNKSNVFCELLEPYFGYHGVAVSKRNELAKRELDKDYRMNVIAIFKEKKK